MANDKPDLFDGLPQDQARDLISLGTRRKLADGAVLFELGDEADSLFLVDRGRIVLTLPIKVGGRDEDVLVEERQRGETLGWSALIPPHRFTLKAAAPLDSELIALPRTALLEHFAEHPDVGYVVIRNLAAIMGERLHIFQTMWLREMQRTVIQRSAAGGIQ